MKRVWRFGTVESTEREVYLLIQHVAGVFIQELAVVLRHAGITPEQYHVLRVLRDAGSAGLACNAVAERSVSGDPDVTRLLDRLEKQGWATRMRDESDRRVVLASITGQGKKLLERLEGPVAAVHARQFAGLPKSQLTVLRNTMQQLAEARIGP
jgi:DNA-binding MarR family transcriptional regulator